MLELKNICYTVSTPETGEQTILKDISVTIPDGKLIVFTGPNGGGKTTLAKVIMGLVDADERSDPLERRGHHRTSTSRRARSCGISYGFQQPPRFKGITVRDLLTIASRRQQAHQGQVLPATSRRWACARTTISTARWTSPSRAARSSASRSPRMLARHSDADDLRRARGRHRPVELRPADRDLRAASTVSARAHHDHHFPSGAHHLAGRRDHRGAAAARSGTAARPRRSSPASWPTHCGSCPVLNR